MYKITFYVPKTHLDTVKDHLFAKGAGKIGHYDKCAWQTLGTGQYQPLEQSNPYKGNRNQISQEAEYLVEMVCEDNLIKSVLETLIETHPYENPAYGAWKITLLEDL